MALNAAVLGAGFIGQNFLWRALSRGYRYQHRLDCKILRLGNPDGPGQNIQGRQGFIAIAIEKLMAGENIQIRGDGSTVRNFVFNVGGGKEQSLNDIPASILGISLEKDVLGKTPKISLEQGFARTRAFHGIKSRTDFPGEAITFHSPHRTRRYPALARCL